MDSNASKALFVGSDVYREAAFGKHHPLSIIRVSGVMDVCQMLGWFDHEQFRESPQASVVQLKIFITRITLTRSSPRTKRVVSKKRCGKNTALGRWRIRCFQAYSNALPQRLADLSWRPSWQRKTGLSFTRPAAPIMDGPVVPVVSVISTTRYSPFLPSWSAASSGYSMWILMHIMGMEYRTRSPATRGCLRYRYTRKNAGRIRAWSRTARPARPQPAGTQGIQRQRA